MKFKTHPMAIIRVTVFLSIVLTPLHTPIPITAPTIPVETDTGIPSLAKKWTTIAVARIETKAAGISI